MRDTEPTKLRFRDKFILKRLLNKHRKELERIRKKHNDKLDDKNKETIKNGILALEEVFNIQDDDGNVYVETDYDLMNTDELLNIYIKGVEELSKVIGE